jgi:hypothetical protein
MKTDAEKLEVLAQWFDHEQFKNGRWNGAKGSTEIQDDLRDLAERIRFDYPKSHTVGS